MKVEVWSKGKRGLKRMLRWVGILVEIERSKDLNTKENRGDMNRDSTRPTSNHTLNSNNFKISNNNKINNNPFNNNNNLSSLTEEHRAMGMNPNSYPMTIPTTEYWGSFTTMEDKEDLSYPVSVGTHNVFTKNNVPHYTGPPQEDFDAFNARELIKALKRV